MSEKHFEFTVAIKANEATLHKIEEQLCHNTANQSALTNLIDEWIKEQLIGPAHYFKVEVRTELSVIPGEGGLNANEWLGSQKFSTQPVLEYEPVLD